MKLKNKLKIKKYQTQNFVNQYLSQNKRVYYDSLRKEALKTLKEEGFENFEYQYISREYWTIGVSRSINATYEKLLALLASGFLEKDDNNYFKIWKIY